MEDDEPRSPSPVNKPFPALRRRSSVGRSIRKSRSMVGVAFEDQIAAIGSANLSMEDKIRQIVNMSLSAATTLVQQDYDSQEVSVCESGQADLADFVKSEIGRRPLLDSGFPAEVASELTGKARQEKRQPYVPPRLRSLNEIAERSEAESARWKEILCERKIKLTAAKTEKKLVVTGEKAITAGDNLPKSEDAWLRGISDGQSEWASLGKQEKMLHTAALEMLERLARKRRVVDDLQCMMDGAAAAIARQSAAKTDDIAAPAVPKVTLTEADFDW